MCETKYNIFELFINHDVIKLLSRFETEEECDKTDKNKKRGYKETDLVPSLHSQEVINNFNGKYDQEKSQKAKNYFKALFSQIQHIIKILTILHHATSYQL